MTARKMVDTSGQGQRPNPDEEKIPERFGDASQTAPDEPAPEHKGITGKPPVAPDSKDSDPRGPESK